MPRPPCHGGWVKTIHVPISSCPEESCYDYRALTAGSGAVEGVAFRGRMWFGHGDPAASLVEALDPTTNRSVATVELGDYAGSVVKGAGSLWAESYGRMTLYRIAAGG